MIDIRIECEDRQIQTKYHLEGFVSLNDIALALLEIDRIKLQLLEESESCPPEVEIRDEKE